MGASRERTELKSRADKEIRGKPQTKRTDKVERHKTGLSIFFNPKDQKSMAKRETGWKKAAEKDVLQYIEEHNGTDKERVAEDIVRAYECASIVNEEIKKIEDTHIEGAKVPKIVGEMGEERAKVKERRRNMIKEWIGEIGGVIHGYGATLKGADYYGSIHFEMPNGIAMKCYVCEELRKDKVLISFLGGKNYETEPTRIGRSRLPYLTETIKTLGETASEYKDVYESIILEKGKKDKIRQMNIATAEALIAEKAEEYGLTYKTEHKKILTRVTFKLTDKKEMTVNIRHNHLLDEIDNMISNVVKMREAFMELRGDVNIRAIMSDEGWKNE